MTTINPFGSLNNVREYIQATTGEQCTICLHSADKNIKDCAKGVSVANSMMKATNEVSLEQ